MRVNYEGKYGIVDSNGKLVVPLNFDYIYHYSECLAKIEIDGKSGFVDANGNVVITPDYSDAGDFSEGLAWVKKDDKSGFWLSAFISKHTVGTSIARPAFGTNAICRMQIQPSLDKGPGWIALQGDCLFRKRGRAMLVPTHVEARTLLRGAHCAPLRGRVQVGSNAGGQ